MIFREFGPPQTPFPMDIADFEQDLPMFFSDLGRELDAVIRPPLAGRLNAAVAAASIVLELHPEVFAFAFDYCESLSEWIRSAAVAHALYNGRSCIFEVHVQAAGSTTAPPYTFRIKMKSPSSITNVANEQSHRSQRPTVTPLTTLVDGQLCPSPMQVEVKSAQGIEKFEFDGECVTIGRKSPEAPQPQIALSVPTDVSRLQLALVRNGDAVAVWNLGANPVTVGGVSLPGASLKSLPGDPSAVPARCIAELSEQTEMVIGHAQPVTLRVVRWVSAFQTAVA